MVKICVDNVMLHGLHGLYNGEPLTGGQFEVSVHVSFDDTDIEFNNLRDTISYVSLFEIVKLRMATPTQLLEKVAMDILDEIRDRFPVITASWISIHKLQPPIVQFEGRVGVVMSREY